MFILDTPIKGDKNSTLPQPIYKLKWSLIDENNNILSESAWVSNTSFLNNDGWDQISWSKAFNENKDKICEVQVFCQRENIIQLAMSCEIDVLKNLSYSMVMIPNSEYKAILGIGIHTKDQLIEWLIDGNVYKKDK